MITGYPSIFGEKSQMSFNYSKNVYKSLFKPKYAKISSKMLIGVEFKVIWLI